MTTQRTETEAETEAGLIAAILALCDELIESGALNQESLSRALAAQALQFQSDQLLIAGGILETLSEAITDSERRSFRKTLKEEVTGPPPNRE